MYEQFPRIPYSDAMLKYGTDKPDLRNPLIINDITDIFSRDDVSFEICSKNLLNLEVNVDVLSLKILKINLEAFLIILTDGQKNKVPLV